MATHLIFDMQGAAYLATETPDGFLTTSGVIPNSAVRTACPIDQAEKRIKRIGDGDEVWYPGLPHTKLKAELVTNYPVQVRGWGFTPEGLYTVDSAEPTIFHLSEARRLGLIPTHP